MSNELSRRRAIELILDSYSQFAVPLKRLFNRVSLFVVKGRLNRKAEKTSIMYNHYKEALGTTTLGRSENIVKQLETHILPELQQVKDEELCEILYECRELARQYDLPIKHEIPDGVIQIAAGMESFAMQIEFPVAFSFDDSTPAIFSHIPGSDISDHLRKVFFLRLGEEARVPMRPQSGVYFENLIRNEDIIKFVIDWANATGQYDRLVEWVEDQQKNNSSEFSVLDRKFSVEKALYDLAEPAGRSIISWLKNEEQKIKSEFKARYAKNEETSAVENSSALPQNTSAEKEHPFSFDFVFQDFRPGFKVKKDLFNGSISGEVTVYAIPNVNFKTLGIEDVGGGGKAGINIGNLLSVGAGVNISEGNVSGSAAAEAKGGLGGGVSIDGGTSMEWSKEGVDLMASAGVNVDAGRVGFSAGAE
jgi:hypothetical protein